ncbi:MAG: isopentenyl-diphosphate Delta-isomerase [Actinomycetota bacterium]
MRDDEERILLVDADDHIIGTAEKLDTHRKGALHRAFSVIVWSSAGRLLLQKRATRKYHSGGLWTNACCGHPRPDENIEAAARRRLEEEMGFTCKLSPLGTITYRAELDHGMVEHELVHVFRGIYDGTVTPDPAEAEDYHWASLAELRADIFAAPERYSVWLREYLSAQWPLALA